MLPDAPAWQCRRTFPFQLLAVAVLITKWVWSSHEIRLLCNTDTSSFLGRWMEHPSLSVCLLVSLVLLQRQWNIMDKPACLVLGYPLCHGDTREEKKFPEALCMHSWTDRMYRPFRTAPNQQQLQRQNIWPVQETGVLFLPTRLQGLTSV